MRNRLKELRARDGFNQTQLAKQAGISRQTVSLIERNDFMPSILTRLKLRVYSMNQLKMSLYLRRRFMKVKRYLILLVLGGIIGGFVGSSMGSISNFLSNVNFAHTHFGLIICIIASLIIIGLTFYLWKVQKMRLNLKIKVSILLKMMIDLFEMKSNLNFNKSSIIIYIQLIISFVALLLIVFGHGSNSDVLYAIIPYMLTIIPSIMLGFFNRRFDSRYPKIGEKIILKNLSTFG